MRNPSRDTLSSSTQRNAVAAVLTARRNQVTLPLDVRRLHIYPTEPTFHAASPLASNQLFSLAESTPFAFVTFSTKVFAHVIDSVPAMCTTAESIAFSLSSSLIAA